jgi:hypothetical protein
MLKQTLIASALVISTFGAFAQAPVATPAAAPAAVATPAIAKPADTMKEKHAAGKAKHQAKKKASAAKPAAPAKP